MQDIIDLAAAISYQDGSVVSKELTKAGSGSITLFAFGAGQGLSEHTAPYEAFVYIIDGKADISVAGESHEISKGSMLHMPAGKPHSLKAKEKFKMLLVMIKK